MAHSGQRQEDAAKIRVSQQLAMQTNKYVWHSFLSARTNGQEESDGGVVQSCPRYLPRGDMLLL